MRNPVLPEDKSTTTDDPDHMLVVESGIPGVRAIPLNLQACIIGASPTADVFVDNPYVSRMHAQIIRDGDNFSIRDLESKNGTFVNGMRLKKDNFDLRSGDRIELAEGQVILRFQSRGATVTLPVSSPPEGDDLVIDPKSRDVWVRGEKLETQLSRKEFDVLNLLFQKRGQACSKEDIAAVGWQDRMSGDVANSEIEQSIRRLRLRIELDPSQPEYIVTVRGFGYKLVRPVATDSESRLKSGIQGN